MTHQQLNESDIESQMDDYMIKDLTNSDSSCESSQKSRSDDDTIQNMGNHGMHGKHPEQRDNNELADDHDSSHSSSGGHCQHQEVDYESRVHNKME